MFQCIRYDLTGSKNINAKGLRREAELLLESWDSRDYFPLILTSIVSVSDPPRVIIPKPSRVRSDFWPPNYPTSICILIRGDIKLGENDPQIHHVIKMKGILPRERNNSTNQNEC